LAEVLKVDWAQATREVKAGIAAADLRQEAGYASAERAIMLLSGILHPSAIAELDGWYQRARKEVPDETWLRSEAVLALRFNQFGGAKSLIDRYPTASLEVLEKWLSTDPSPPVLQGGLEVLGWHARHIPPSVVKNATGKVWPSELDDALRKAKLNALEDYSDQYRTAMEWVDQVAAEYQAGKRPKIDYSVYDAKLLYYLRTKLRSDEKALSDRRPDIAQRIKRIEGLAQQAAAEEKAAKDKEQQQKLRQQKQQLEWLATDLRYLLQEI
jgi:hypothetical protein